MKHAGGEALNLLEPLLAQLRYYRQLKEKKPGIFYLRNKSFLHFHEDPAGLFADLCADGRDLRLPVNGPDEVKALLETVEAVLKG